MWPGYPLRLMSAPSLPVLCEAAAQLFMAVKGYALREAARWREAAVRRLALGGLAAFAASLRRLIHLLAREEVLAPLRVRTDLPRSETGPPAARRYRFRLHEQPPPRPKRDANPHARPDPADFAHALFLSRLSNLAAAWRARRRIARRLARRWAASAARLKRPAFTPHVAARLPPPVLAYVTHLEARLTAPDTS
jgi:hypothetical protein